MTQEEMKIELEELAVRFSEGWHEGIKIDASDIMLLNKAAQALVQTQEPWCMKMNDCKTKREDCPDEPPQRTWVGLTLDEIALLHANYPNPQGFALALQAKLKEKNT